MKSIVTNFFPLLLVWALIIGPNFFFLILGALGLSYSGIETSNSFLIFSLLLVVFIFFLNLFRVFLYSEISFIDLFASVVIVLLLLHQAIFIIFDPSITSPSLIKNLGTFFIFGISGAVAASWLIKSNNIFFFIKLAELISVIIILFLVLSIKETFFSGSREVEIGGATYQNFSYLASTAFSMLISKKVFLDNKIYTFKFFSSRIYNLLLPVILTVCVAMVFLAGGRGAALMIALFSLLYINFLSFKRKLLFLAILLVYLPIILLIVFSLNTDLNALEIFSFGFNRITDLLVNSSDIITIGSREDIYSKSIAIINEKALTGYGSFNIHDNIIHPHNVFLEIFMQFGLIIGLSIVFIMIGIFGFDISFNCTPLKLWIYSLFLMTLVMLMFSGSYIEIGFFWFTLSLILHYAFYDYINHKNLNA